LEKERVRCRGVKISTVQITTNILTASGNPLDRGGSSHYNLFSQEIGNPGTATAAGKRNGRWGSDGTRKGGSKTRIKNPSSGGMERKMDNGKPGGLPRGTLKFHGKRSMSTEWVKAKKKKALVVLGTRGRSYQKAPLADRLGQGGGKGTQLKKGGRGQE